MAGSMYRTPGGAWMLGVYTGRDPLTGKGLEDAELPRYQPRGRPGAGRIRARGLGGAAVDSKTFGELLERWFAARSGDWSPSTVQQTRWVIDGKLQGLADRWIRDLGVEDLDRFYAALRQRGGRDGQPLAGSTVARIYGIVRFAPAQAVVWGWRPDNPAERATPGRLDTAEIRPPSPDDVRRLFAAAMEKDVELLTFVALEAETGARRGELSALRFSDFVDGSVSRSATIWRTSTASSLLSCTRSNPAFPASRRPEERPASQSSPRPTPSTTSRPHVPMADDAHRGGVRRSRLDSVRPSPHRRRHSRALVPRRSGTGRLPGRSDHRPPRNLPRAGEANVGGA